MLDTIERWIRRMPMSEWLVFETLYNVPVEWIPAYNVNWSKVHPYIDRYDVE